MGAHSSNGNGGYRQKRDGKIWVYTGAEMDQAVASKMKRAIQTKDCLKCDKPFESIGRQNRLCVQCKELIASQTEGSLYSGHSINLEQGRGW